MATRKTKPLQIKQATKIKQHKPPGQSPTTTQPTHSQRPCQQQTTQTVVKLMKKKENLREVLRNVSLHEIVMLMFLLLKEHHFPVYPVEVSRKKRIPNEEELIARLNPEVAPIYNELRNFLKYQITENFLNRDIAISAFTDSLLNYSTSRN